MAFKCCRMQASSRDSDSDADGDGDGGSGTLNSHLSTSSDGELSHTTDWMLTHLLTHSCSRVCVRPLLVRVRLLPSGWSESESEGSEGRGRGR